MQNATIVSMMCVAFLAACKETPKYSGRNKADNADATVNQQETKTPPAPEKTPVAEVSQEKTLPEMPTPQISQFPYVVEYPKEQIKHIPARAAAEGEDNSCMTFVKGTQSATKLRLSYNMLGAALPPGSPVTSGLAVSPAVRCFVWGRIKNVPAGYRMAVSFATNSEMHVASNMKAYMAANAANGTPELGGLGRFATVLRYFSPNPAAVNGLWYDEMVQFSRGNINFAVDTSGANDTVIPMSTLGQLFTPQDADTCPTAEHELVFYVSVSAGVTARIADRAITTIPDGFTSSFYVKELPELAFNLSKCN